MNKLHRTHTKRKAINNGTPFHPPIMFCGDCSACAAPPPPISMASFTIVDEESQEEKSPQRVKSMHLRVYNSGSSGVDHENTGDDNAGRMSILKTILRDLDGVKNITVSKSHLPSRSKSDEDEFLTTKTNVELVDPTSCMVKVEYDSELDSANAPPGTAATITENPQELKEAKDVSTHQAILNRLSDTGFDYAVLSDFSSSSMTNSSEALISSPNYNNSSAIPEPPMSCRTRIRVQGICCSSEVPVVRSILKPLPGVRKLGINVATKVVFVDHDPGVISATLLSQALNDEKFGAEILTDGGLELMNKRSAGSDNGSSSPFLKNIRELPRSRFVESTFFLPGMITHTNNNNKMESCPIRKLLRQNFFKDHLRAFHLHAPSGTLKVEHDPELLSADKMMGVLIRGLKDGDWGKIELAHDGAAEGLTLPASSSANKDEGEDGLNESQRSFCQGLKYNVIISGIFWVLSLLSFAGGSWACLKYAGIISVISGMPPVVMKAWMTVRRMQFDANCMMVTAAFGALALGEFDEAASVAFLFAVSERLEARATFKARRALGEILSLRPEYANIVDPESGGIVIVLAANIPVGSIVSVRTGDKVPADGIVVEGSSSVDVSSLTGEALPVEKHAGDDVSSGSINVGARQLVVQTTSTVGDSTLSRLIQLVEEAQANTSETEKLVDAFARKYTPLVLAIALFICTIPWLYGREIGRYWTLNALILIVIACPCALTISTPVTYSAGLAAAAQRGIIIKGGSKLEALGNVSHVLLDKTGTITTGRFALSHLDIVGKSKSREEVLELLAVMEAPSSHPLSACLVSAAKEEGIEVSADISVTEHTILNGEGVTANVDDKRVYVGNDRLFKRLGMHNISPQHSESAKQWSDEGGTVGYVGIEGVGIVGMFCVKDTIREEAEHVISSLLHSGTKVIMLTGDSEGAAQAVGREVGLDRTNIQSQLLPEDKMHYVSSLKGSPANKHASLSGKKQLVLFVGDGVNDAPSLALSDVGVAMGEGASLAMEMSDVTLMDSNLSKLLFSMKLGAKVITTVKENIAFSILVNIIAVVLTFLGKMTLLWAIVSDVGVMLLVTLNGMKLLSKRTVDAIEGNRTIRPVLKRKNDQHYERPPTADDMEMT